MNEKLLQLIQHFYFNLKKAAAENRITREAPKTARDICAGYMNMWKRNGVKESLLDTEIRAMVNFCRRNGLLIGSSQQGYWKGDEADMVGVLATLKNRRDNFNEAIEGIEKGLELREQLRKQHLDELARRNNPEVITDVFGLEVPEDVIESQIESLFIQAIEQARSQSGQAA